MSSLPRRLEAEVMDTPEEATDYDAMDHSAVNQLFASDFLAEWDGANPILDVGTGTAQIPIVLCQNDERPRILAVDLSEAMLRIGRANVEAANLAERIELRLTDAKSLPFADGEVAAVISNSIVHHVPEPAGVIAEMVRVLRQGGRIFVRDLHRPADLDQLKKLVARHAAGANERQRQLFADSLHAALTADEVRSMVTRLGFAPDTVSVTSDRHWTWSAVKLAHLH